MYSGAFDAGKTRLPLPQETGHCQMIGDDCRRGTFTTFFEFTPGLSLGLFPIIFIGLGHGLCFVTWILYGNRMDFPQTQLVRPHLHFPLSNLLEKCVRFYVRVSVCSKLHL